MEDVDAASPLPPGMADPDLKAAMQAPITVMLGPVGLLLRELHSPEQSLLDAEEIRLLRDALTELCIPLMNMSEEDDASFMSRWWMKIVRELCYDAHDYLNFVARDRHGFSELPDCAKAVYSDLLARAKDARERRKGFQWYPKTTWTERWRAHTHEANDRRLSKILALMPGPLAVRTTPGVVLAEAPNKLVELLALDDNVDYKTLKVIPIIGCAGVGKTTAARTLYHKHGGKFQCRAFVSVSPNPDMRGVLTSMLSQLKAPSPPGFPDVLDLIGAIRNHLQGKGYFIVLDDLWTASVWHVVSRAFPRGYRRSRVITTTQVHDVALACSGYHPVCIYKMELLDEHESRELFFRMVFSSAPGDGCSPGTKEVSYEIIRKCEGLPLAIVSIASLLASELSIVMEDWRHIKNSFCSTSQGMKDVLNLMYNSLPIDLRTCLLYLSMYPQGYLMKKDELVKQWVAEGLISAVEGLRRGMVEIAEGYFDELVSRAIVQAVDTKYNGEVLSCTVHHLVLDFIRSKSLEENFVITVDYFQSTLALPDNVRRLSVQFGGVESAYFPESIVTSKVRSLVFWGFFKCAPPSIMEYGFLRILILHIWADEDDGESFDLTGITMLSLLKYLNIECNITVELPHKIGMLRYLETLEVDAILFAVPSDIINLERLLHLRLPSESILPQGLAHMTSLCTLGNFDLSHYSTENVLQLGGLSNLQDLKLTCSMVQPAENLEKNMQLLGSIVEKLSFLQTITLVPASVSSHDDDAWAAPASIIIPPDGFNMASPPPDLLLRRIELSRHCCIFFRVPKWFGELRKLCILRIAIRRLSRNDVEILERMPALVALTLSNQTTPAEKMVMTEEGFHVLRYFKFSCSAPCLSFAQGAMRRLQKLNLGFNSKEWRSDTIENVGLSHLRGLTDVCVRLGAGATDNFNVEVVESALEAVVWNDPNSPSIRIKIVGVIFDGEDESTLAQEIQEDEENRILQIPLNVEALKDFVAWHYTKSGTFSVRSAYHAELEYQFGRHFSNRNWSGNAQLNGVWKELWHLQLSGKIKHFGGEILPGIIACYGVLQTDIYP
ncbi:disease resistance protein RGA5-like [Hordeum vulgare subsp. vulgare]|uniref:disease resistance protein RGA5-like n=1 Tax=Hordeum vulgare subsp. vulgare TaxID=112509 RepID=UPI001D1A3F68|nr:disease resistance protein RGA5-like [Hordeum vulgare subsp. vulgare]